MPSAETFVDPEQLDYELQALAGPRHDGPFGDASLAAEMASPARKE